MSEQRALAGVRVIDLSRVLAGPYCTMLLGDLGADVLKVEQPDSGDGTRQWGPPWIADQSAYFLSANRNKRSLTLNLKHATGQAILRRLLSDADVLIENFKVGTLAGWGLDGDALAALNPRLVMCSITGYGQSGPYRDQAGYDFMIQAQGGIMSITGPADGAPYKVGVAIADITAGLFAANAILAALLERERSGRGQQIDVALLDAQLAWLANVAHNYFATGAPPQRHGNAHPNIVPYQTFATADGHLALAIGSDDQYRRFCMLAGCPELWHDTRLQTNAGRVAHRDEVVNRLAAVLRERRTQAWLDLLQPASIPAGPINDIPTILNDPHVLARNMVQTVLHPTAGAIRQLGPVARLSRTPAAIDRPPPTLGQHSDEILLDAGYTQNEVAAFRQQGVI